MDVREIERRDRATGQAGADWRIEKHHGGKFWNVVDPAGALVCVCVYRKGAREVVRRLMPLP